jgi:hypothetical protein
MRSPLKGMHTACFADVVTENDDPLLSWCPVSGVVAVGVRAAADLAHVHLASVHDLQHKITLCVPLAGE